MPYEFKRSDVYGLASALGAETHERGEELFFRWCPYCKGGGHDKNTFSVNLENGTFKCFRAGCGAQGHLVQLARDFGYPLEFDDGRKKKYRTLPQRPVKVTNPAVRYLESRGISRAVTERYRITTQRGHDNILVFPFYDGDGVMQFVKYRKTDFVKGRDRNKEWSEKDTMPILFGMDRCEGKDRLVITEGQIDSLSLTEAGIQNAVSVPTGAMGFTWLENVWEWINGFAEIIVFGDCEKGKITLVDALSRRLPKPVKVVRQEDYLGEKDANDILRKYGTEALRQAVANARIILVTHIKELADVAAVDLSKLPKINTGIAMLDRVIGGLYYGQVILVTGKRGEGKSTVMSQLAAEALNQGLRVLAYSGELPDYHFRRWLDMQLAGPQNVETSYNQFSDAVYRLPEDVTEQIGEWYRGRAYIYDNNAVDDEDAALLDTVEQAVCRYGINLVCIDNLMTAIDAASTDTQYLKQSHFVRQLKQLAVKHNIAVLLVAHPRKTQGDVSENDAVSGSADITNRVDTVISYVKNGEDAPRRRKASGAQEPHDRQACAARQRDCGGVRRKVQTRVQRRRTERFSLWLGKRERLAARDGRPAVLRWKTKMERNDYIRLCQRASLKTDYAGVWWAVKWDESDL